MNDLKNALIIQFRSGRQIFLVVSYRTGLKMIMKENICIVATILWPMILSFEIPIQYCTFSEKYQVDDTYRSR